MIDKAASRAGQDSELRTDCPRASYRQINMSMAIQCRFSLELFYFPPPLAENCRLLRGGSLAMRHLGVQLSDRCMFWSDVSWLEVRSHSGDVSSFRLSSGHRRFPSMVSFAFRFSSAVSRSLALGTQTACTFSYGVVPSLSFFYFFIF